VLLAVSCWLSAAFGQWLETTITLPSGSSPGGLGYNPAENKVYCAYNAQSALGIINGATNTVDTTLGATTSWGIWCYGPDFDRMYWISCYHTAVIVIAGDSDRIVASPPTGQYPTDLCYNTVNGKVYSADYYSNQYSVFDAATNQRRGTKSIGSQPVHLGYNPHDNKVYCSTTDGHLLVINGATDSIIRNLNMGNWVYDICWNSTDSKVYCPDRDNNVVRAVSGSRDSVVATVPVTPGVTTACFNSREDKVYVGGTSGVSILDGKADTVLRTLSLGYATTDLLYDSINNKVYCLNRDNNQVTVVDGASNNVIRTIAVGSNPYDLTWNPVQNRVYVSNGGSNTISVIRDSMMTGTGEGCGPLARCSRPQTTVARGILELGPSLLAAHCYLLSSAGRKMLDLNPGSNDVSRLSPGVYFIAENGRGTADARRTGKIVISH
jgi:YVTN family beta-propeller protein